MENSLPCLQGEETCWMVKVTASKWQKKDWRIGSMYVNSISIKLKNLVPSDRELVLSTIQIVATSKKTSHFSKISMLSDY